jgi:hypothetical protein
MQVMLKCGVSSSLLAGHASGYLKVKCKMGMGFYGF